jgi:hypothetical protein
MDVTDLYYNLVLEILSNFITFGLLVYVLAVMWLKTFDDSVLSLSSLWYVGLCHPSSHIFFNSLFTLIPPAFGKFSPLEL